MVKDVTFGQIISESFENIASDSTKKSKLCDGDKAERELCHKWICRVLVKSLTPPHFLRLWPIGRRNAALIGTSPASTTHTLPYLMSLRWVQRRVGICNLAYITRLLPKLPLLGVT